MSEPELPVVAEGDGPDGERWFLRAGGSAGSYYTMLDTVRRDGRRTWGTGMGGPALYAGSLINSSTGQADDGPLRVIVRADPRVRRVRLQSAGEQRDLPVAAADLAVGLTFFAALLPWSGLDAIQCFDAVGQPLAD
jgi:hypothetical protein